MRTNLPSTTSDAKGRSAVGPAAAVVLAVWLLWAWLSGGYSPQRWGSIGLILVLLFALCVALVAPEVSRKERTRLLALSALALFVVWNFLSLAWADFPGDAWAGADKVALYGVSFAFFACWRWSPRASVFVLAAYALGIATIALIVLIRADTSAHPATFFQESRLLDPIGYANGNVGLWMSAFWPAVYLGTTRALPLVRPFALAAAALLLETAILGQSRVWPVVLAVAAVLAVLLARQRVRFFAGLVICAGLAALAAPALLDVYDKANAEAPLGPPLDRVLRAVVLTSVAAAVIGAVWTTVDRRVTLSRGVHRAVAGLAGVGVIAAIIVGLSLADSFRAHPVRWTEQHWRDFTHDRPVSEKSFSSRFSGYLGGDRYQEWRIAWLEFNDHPLLGNGADNYAAPYLLRRSNPRHEPLYPHSLPMSLLSNLGAPGALLFLVFVAAGMTLAVRCRNRGDPVTGGAAAVALTSFLYWLLHASVDWFWEIPVLAAPALGLLGLAGSIHRGGSAVASMREPRRLLRSARPVAVSVAAGALTVAIALQWLAASYEHAAAAVWPRSPKTAYARLERAADLDPLSAEPLALEGSIALRLHDERRARRAFLQALDREPKAWYPYLELGLLDGSLGRYRVAAAALRRAGELNPRDPVIAFAARLVAGRKKIEPQRLNDLYLAEVNRRLGRHLFPPR
jgi:hypothetical protein